MRVLLLEDSRFDAELLLAALAAAFPQAAVRHVRDGAAYSAALDEPWDIVLSDFELPGYSGLQALAAARARAPETPFVFVSGVIGEDNAVELMKRGATDYVSKGRLERLPMVVERALQEVEQRRARGVAETRLRESDELLAHVLDALPDYAVILLDADATIRSWHRAAAQLFGHPAPGPIGQPVATLFLAEDRAAGVPERELREAAEAGKCDARRWMQRVDGSRFHAEGVVTPLRDAHGALRGYAKVVHDTTPAHEAAVTLREAKEAAERANAAKDRFLAVLSHELRTPLAPIATAAQTLQRAVALEPPLRGLLPMITRNVALEARLIDDLLDISAISAGKIALRQDRVDPQALLVDVLAMLEEERSSRAITIERRLDAAAPHVTGDAARVQQVLWNVVRNAIKFSPPGRKVHLSTAQRDGRFVFVCRDDGIGIPAEALPRIFTPFAQADDHILRRYGGLGLGLSIAKALVDAHGGTLEVASEGAGRGATFTLTLPLAGEAGAAAAPPGPARADAAGRRLLLVEDNHDAATALVIAFESLGYRVRLATSRAEALALAEAHEHDVVVSDIGLPDGSGHAIGEALRERVPLIAVSGYGSADDLRASKAAGFAAHFVKPVDPEELHAAIDRLLAGA